MGVNHEQPQDPFVMPCRRREKKAKGISDESENRKTQKLSTSAYWKAQWINVRTVAETQNSGHSYL